MAWMIVCKNLATVPKNDMDGYLKHSPWYNKYWIWVDVLGVSSFPDKPPHIPSRSDLACSASVSTSGCFLIKTAVSSDCHSQRGGEGKSCHLGILPAALFTMWNRLISRPADIDKISKENQSPAVDESLCDFEVVPCCEENVKIRKVNDARHGETTTHHKKNMKKQSLHHKNLAGMTNLMEKTRVKKIDLDQENHGQTILSFFLLLSRFSPTFNGFLRLKLQMFVLHLST